MPFFKPNRYAVPRSRMIESMTQRHGLRHTIFNTRGDRYVGQWQHDKKTGKGVILTRSDELYEGDMENNRRHGFGVLAQRMPNSNVFRLSYRGDWRGGKMDGQGMRLYPDGSFFIGHFKRGKRHGHGQQWYADGAFFDGEYQNDLREGPGVLVRADGNRYEGRWKGDLKHGKGRFYHLTSGQLQEGVWSADMCAYSQIRDIDFRQCCIDPTPCPIPDVALLYANRLSHMGTERALLGFPDSWDEESLPERPKRASIACYLSIVSKISL